MQPDGRFYTYIMIKMYKRDCLNEMWELYERVREDNNVICDSVMYRQLAYSCTTLHKCQVLLTDMQVQYCL